MVITIDGPAGAGKSSVARALAQRLQFHFLDTGAMYRAVAFAAVREQINWSDTERLAQLARRLDIRVTETDVLLDEIDVTEAIRSMEITAVVHYVADHAGIRSQLVMLQRRAAAVGDFVTEGRDQGTVVFPDAMCKIFLTASPKERARRRLIELESRGEHLPFDEVLKLQEERDQRDRNREVGRLIAAEDAILVSSDNKRLDQVVDELETIVLPRLVDRNAKS